MTSLRDAYDEPVSTVSQAARDHYVEGVHCILTNNTGAEPALNAAIAADEGFALAYAALAAALQPEGRGEEARAAVARAGTLVAVATAREKAQVSIIAAAVEGRLAEALPLGREHLRQFPRDAMALAQTVALLNTSGTATRKQETLALFDELAPAYGDEPWFLGRHSFASNELFFHARARELADRSFALNPRSCDCAHSLSHVMFETGDSSSGTAFLDGWLDGSAWQRSRSGHLNWHLALFELDQGNWDRATVVYQKCLRPGGHAGPPQIALADAASLAWRYRLRGHDTPAPAEPIQDFARARFPKAGQAFADIHKAMAFALSGDFASLQALTSETNDLLAAGKMPAGPVIPAVVEAVGAFAAGEYERAIGLLEPLSGDFSRVGGSHAQFDVLNDTLLAAYLHAGRFEQLEPLLRERVDRRPSQLDEAWLRDLEALRQTATPPLT